MKNLKKGFTLIELLVVITIIALLVSIVMPALNKAKQQAAMVVCMSGQKQFCIAWTMYAGDHNDFMVSSEPNDEARGDWVANPTSLKGVEFTDLYGGAFTTEDEQRGIEKGKLFKYLKDVDLYHCPADKRYSKASILNNKEFGGWRSYSIPGPLNTSSPEGTAKDQKNGAYIIKKLSKIKRPQEKFCFVEDGDPRGINMGSWVTNPGVPTVITDNVGIFHNKKGTFAFVDGHADTHQWAPTIFLESFTDLIEGGATGLNTSVPAGLNDENVKWLLDHYPHGGVVK